MSKLDLGTLVIDTDDYRETGLRFSLLASSGAGKSYATGVILEEMIDAGIPVVVEDPESEFWTFQEVGALVAGGQRLLAHPAQRAAMRYVVMTDLHLADRPPAMRTASYKDDVLAKVNWVMDRAIALEASRVVITGDVFHRKEPVRTSHRLVQDLRVALTRRYTDSNRTLLPVSLVPGNHDLAADGTITGQPLASVLGGHITMLWGPCADDPNIYGIAWHREFAEESPAIIAKLRDYFDPIIEPPPPLVFGHIPIVLDPNPFGPEQRGWVTAEDVAKVLPSTVELVMAGHMHGGHLVVWNFRDDGTPCVFANPGALSRGSITDADRDRVPQFAIVDYTPGAQTAEEALQVRYEAVPHRPAAEVFRMAERAATVQRSAALDALSQAFVVAEETSVSRESLIATLDALERPDGLSPDDWAAGISIAREAIDAIP